MRTCVGRGRLTIGPPVDNLPHNSRCQFTSDASLLRWRAYLAALRSTMGPAACWPRLPPPAPTAPPVCAAINAAFEGSLPSGGGPSAGGALPAACPRGTMAPAGGGGAPPGPNPPPPRPPAKVLCNCSSAPATVPVWVVVPARNETLLPSTLP